MGKRNLHRVEDRGFGYIFLIFFSLCYDLLYILNCFFFASSCTSITRIDMDSYTYEVQSINNVDSQVVLPEFYV